MSPPAPPLRATVAMAAAELRLTARRGETLLLTLIVPVAVLVFFSAILPVAGVGGGRPVDALLPGTIALSVIATSLVGLGIATAYDRAYGVLKRLGGSPLSRAELIAAKVVAVLAVEAVQVGLLVGVAAVGLGWRVPDGVSVVVVLAAVLVGTVAFAGLGLLLAGILRAETMLAVANALFLACLLVGGIVIPVDELPAPLAAVAGLVPAAALADALRVGLGVAGDAAGPLALLAGWGGIAIVLAGRTFRWD